MSNEEPQSGSPEPGGLGQDGTIPNTDDGIAVGHSPGATTFEPEEDAGSDEEVAAASGEDGKNGSGAESEQSGAEGEQNLDDTIDGAPGPLE